MGVRNRWNSSTSPASIAWAARWGPPTLMSRSAVALRRRTASGSKSRSIRVLMLEVVSSDLEYTILLADRQIRAKSCTTDGWPTRVCIVSQAAITSYIRRPYEVGADRPLEVVDEAVHLLVRHTPVEAAVLVGDMAVERHDA